MSDRKFVACKFRSTDTRSFTYHWDGELPFAVGDMVRVPDRSGDGWKRVEVVSITDEVPQFPTKPVLGKLEDDPEFDAPKQPGEPASALDNEIQF